MSRFHELRKQYRVIQKRFDEEIEKQTGERIRFDTPIGVHLSDEKIAEELAIAEDYCYYNLIVILKEEIKRRSHR